MNRFPLFKCRKNDLPLFQFIFISVLIAFFIIALHALLGAGA